MGGIGTSTKRLEDPPLLLGKGIFVADINHDNQIYMRVVRSDVSHGKLLRRPVHEPNRLSAGFLRHALYPFSTF